MASSRFTVTCKPFPSLSAAELYDIIKLRNEVFVVEQNCVYQDADGKDPESHHLMITDGNTLAAYSRLLPPGVSYKEMSIGRVVSSPAYRGQGAGKLLVAEAIRHCHQLFGAGEIQIGAQLYLEKFYASFGFVKTSDIYLEDGIEHILMRI